MSCKIINQTGADQDALSGMITDFYPYAQQKLGFVGPVGVKLVSDRENAVDPFGKTAFYDPMEKMVSLFVDNRHPKDILRSFSHELVHHLQNERGDLDNLGEMGEGYAQNNKHMRQMESEAYLEGNLILRDHEDGIKAQRKKTMKLNESALREMVMETLQELLDDPNLPKTGVSQDVEMSNKTKGMDEDSLPGGKGATKAGIEALQRASKEAELFDPSGLAKIAPPIKLTPEREFEQIKKRMRPVTVPASETEIARDKKNKERSKTRMAPRIDSRKGGTVRENAEIDEGFDFKPKPGSMLKNLKLKINPELKKDMVPSVPSVRLKATTPIGKAAKRARTLDKTSLGGGVADMIDKMHRETFKKAGTVKEAEEVSDDVKARTEPKDKANKSDFLPQNVRDKINAEDDKVEERKQQNENTITKNKEWDRNWLNDALFETLKDKWTK
jgi:hypothetical protein